MLRHILNGMESSPTYLPIECVINVCYQKLPKTKEIKVLNFLRLISDFEDLKAIALDRVTRVTSVSRKFSFIF